MKLASTIGFLFGTHNIANSLVAFDTCGGFARKSYSSNRRAQSIELAQQIHPKFQVEVVVMGKVEHWLCVIVGAPAGGVIVITLIRGASLLEMAPLTLVLLISAVPVVLPVMVAVEIAVWLKRLAKRACWSHVSAPREMPLRWTCSSASTRPIRLR